MSATTDARSASRSTELALKIASASSSDDAGAMWRAAFAPLFDVAVDEAFHGEIRATHLGDSVISRCAGSAAHRFSRNIAVMRRSQLDHLIIQLYVAGGVRGDYGATSIDTGPGSISLLDLGRAVESRTPGFVNINLIVPRDRLPLSLRKRDVHGVILDPARASTRLLASHLAQLFHDGAALSEPEAAAAVSAALAMVEGGLAALRDGDAATQRMAGRALKRAIEEHIERRLLAPDLSPDRIAEAFHLSRASLYRLFEGSGGVLAHVQARRLDHAFDALTQAGRKPLAIQEIAYRSGFESESAFSRAFRRRFGVSPRDARAARAEPAHARRPAPASLETQTIKDWLDALGAETRSQLY